MNRVQIEKEASEIFKFWNTSSEFFEKIRNAPPVTIAAVMAQLSSTGETGEKMKGLRDSCSAIVHQKLNAELIEVNERLDRSTTRLTIVGIALGVVGIVIGIAQIVVPFGRGH